MPSDDEPNNDGIILPPEPDSQEASAYSQTLLAVVSNYTDRPDLLIAELEKHDPGFVKRMNAASERDAERHRSERFRFGKRQAYAALGVAILAAVVALSCVIIAVSKGAGFWTIMALTVFFAVSQGGTSGFMRIIDAVADMLKRSKGSGEDGG